MKLAIDTSAETCSVALQTNRGQVLHRYAHAPRQHASLILPWVDELLAEAGASKNSLQAVCVSCGPGSFTGLRIGFSLGLSIAYALSIPVYPISSLLCLAQGVIRKHKPKAPCTIISALDARMDEIYLGRYDFQTNQSGHIEWASKSPEQLLRPAQFFIADEGIDYMVAGNGLQAIQSEFSKVIEAQLTKVELLPEYWPEARDHFDLLEKLTPMSATTAELVYIRNNVAKKAKELKSV